MIKNFNLNFNKVVAISDIHGCYEHLSNLLNYFNGEYPILFLGDYIDRGKDSKKVLDLIRELHNKGNCIALKGNHEQLCLDALKDNPEGNLMTFESYLRHGGDVTVKSFTGLKFNRFKKHKKEHLIELYTKFKAVMLEEGYIDFLENLPYFVTINNFLFIHAGFYPKIESLNLIDSKESLWIREEFYNYPHKLDYYVMFGHTVVNELPNFNIDTGIWIQNNKIGIDGGICFGGFLNACLIDTSKNVIDVISAYTNLNTKKIVSFRNSFNINC